MAAYEIHCDGDVRVKIDRDLYVRIVGPAAAATSLGVPIGLNVVYLRDVPGDLMSRIVSEFRKTPMSTGAKLSTEWRQMADIVDLMRERASTCMADPLIWAMNEKPEWNPSTGFQALSLVNTHALSTDHGLGECSLVKATAFSEPYRMSIVIRCQESLRLLAAGEQMMRQKCIDTPNMNRQRLTETPYRTIVSEADNTISVNVRDADHLLACERMLGDDTIGLGRVEIRIRGCWMSDSMWGTWATLTRLDPRPPPDQLD